VVGARRRGARRNELTGRGLVRGGLAASMTRTAMPPKRRPGATRLAGHASKYPMGDVHARSCCFIGTSLIILTPRGTRS